MDKYCWLLFCIFLFSASVVVPTYDGQGTIRNEGILQNAMNEATSSPGNAEKLQCQPPMRTNYVGTVTFVSDRRGAKWFAIVDREIYCPLSNLAGGLPENAQVVEGAMMRLDARWANGNQNPWTCTKIHDLWVPSSVQAEGRVHSQAGDRPQPMSGDAAPAYPRGPRGPVDGRAHLAAPLQPLRGPFVRSGGQPPSFVDGAPAAAYEQGPLDRRTVDPASGWAPPMPPRPAVSSQRPVRSLL